MTRLTSQQRRMLEEATALKKTIDKKLATARARHKREEEEIFKPLVDFIADMDYALIPLRQQKLAIGITDHATFKRLYPKQSDKLRR